MIYRCKTCTSALEYCPELDKMKCLICGNEYKISELDVMSNQDIELSEPELRHINKEEPTFYKMYSCTACGADMIVTHMEAATFCAHCGQPAVVLSRVSGKLAPKYIVPFQISEEMALEIIENKIANSKWAPSEIEKQMGKNIRGIYIPYNICDIDVYDNQVWRHQRINKRSLAVCKVYKREARQIFTNLPIVACSWLDETITRRLEPYDLFYRKPFVPEYLSGYYADRNNMSEGEVHQIAVKRISPLFKKAVRQTVHDNRVKLIRTNPKYHFLKSEYVFLPAWFMTIHYKGEPYTFMVNGQTGKFVGSLPIQWKKVLILFLLLVLLFCLGSVFLPILIGRLLRESEIEYSILRVLMQGLCLLASILYVGSWMDIRWMYKIHNNTKSRIMHMYVRERQGKEEDI